MNGTTIENLWYVYIHTIAEEIMSCYYLEIYRSFALYPCEYPLAQIQRICWDFAHVSIFRVKELEYRLLQLEFFLCHENYCHAIHFSRHRDLNILFVD